MYVYDKPILVYICTYSIARCVHFLFSVHHFTEAAERWKRIVSSSIAGTGAQLMLE
jgi:hypothetical protein